jgi:hypothetical protein
VEDLIQTLHIALAAMQIVGGEVRLARRCRRYLQQLIKIGMFLISSGRQGVAAENEDANNSLLRNQLGGTGDSSLLNTMMESGFLMDVAGSATDEDGSPFGIDMGQFMMADNLYFMNDFSAL